MATLAVQVLSRDSGYALVLAAASDGGDILPNAIAGRGRRQLYMENTSGDAIDVEIQPSGDGALEVGDGSIVDLVPETIALPANGKYMTGYLSPNRFGSAPEVVSADFADLALAWLEVET